MKQLIFLNYLFLAMFAGLSINSGIVSAACRVMYKHITSDAKIQLFTIEGTISDAMLEPIVSKFLLEYIITNPKFIYVDKSYDPKSGQPMYYTRVVYNNNGISNFTRAFVQYLNDKSRDPFWIRSEEIFIDKPGDLVGVWISDSRDVYLRVVMVNRV